MGEPVHSILFVCLGNICRSPLAEGVFGAVVARRGEAARYRLDSAGTGAWHLGSAPDPRSIAVAARHGVDIGGQKARKLDVGDYAAFDLILAMDRSNLDDIEALAPAGGKARLDLFLRAATGEAREVPDPYYGGTSGFDDVYRMVLQASEALAETLARGSLPTRGHTSSTT
jgi:protein-tyrosine phosphatase